MIDEVLISRIFNGTSIAASAGAVVKDEAKIVSLEVIFTLVIVSSPPVAWNFLALRVSEICGITSVTIT